MKFFVQIFFFFFLLSCTKDKVGHEPTPYSLSIPSHFPSMQIPEDNPMTVEGVELGRFLFYETMLSGDNTINCASCHLPGNSFSDSNQFSVGIDGIYGNRQSMALINMGWDEFFFWDGRASSNAININLFPSSGKNNQASNTTTEKARREWAQRLQTVQSVGVGTAEYQSGRGVHRIASPSSTSVDLLAEFLHEFGIELA